MSQAFRKFASVVIFGLALGGTSGALAQDMKVAVLDMASALFNSEAAKEIDAQMKEETGEDEQKVRELAQQIQSLQQQLQKDSAVMSDAEKRRLSGQIEEHGVQYQYLMQKLQETVQQRRQQFQQAYAPNLIQAIQEVVEEEGYDLVLRAEAVLHYRNAYDITAMVTEKLNEQE